MPQYKTHNHFNLIIILPLFLALGHLTLHLPSKDLLIFGGAFCYGSFFMNPDLDLANQIKLFSLRGLLTLPFRTYSWIFRHRGLSHSLIFGTLTRVIWLVLFIFVLSYGFAKIGFKTISWKSFYDTYYNEFLFIFIGVLLADLSHLFLDAVAKKKA